MYLIAYMLPKLILYIYNLIKNEFSFKIAIAIVFGVDRPMCKGNAQRPINREVNRLATDCLCTFVGRPPKLVAFCFLFRLTGKSTG